MRIADAHCDTLTKFPTNPFNSENAHWNISKYNEIGGKFQIFAIFTPPELSGDAATSFVTKAIGDFHRYNSGEVALVKSKDDFRHDKINIMLSIEGASPIQQEISYLHSFYNMGVRAMGLTWKNRKNDEWLIIFTPKKVQLATPRVSLAAQMVQLRNFAFILFLFVLLVFSF
ncbi:MAG: membrane dipeptidase [Candidatus Kapabacteria bacterium]|nr:membrane dipeptidase [Candidatus Kapabacteria bacterium]